MVGLRFHKILTSVLCVNDEYQNVSTGLQRHRENRENGLKKSLSGKTKGIWKFGQNTGKTQGILLAQVVNTRILKVKNIAMFAA